MKKGMNCDDVRRWFSQRLNKAAAITEMESAIEHLDGCEECRFLLNAFIHEPNPENMEGLVAEVLERTSGSVCARAKPLLCDYIDGYLAEAEVTLLRTHLDHCAECSELALLLQESVSLLPQIASLEPDRFFTSSVLKATRVTQQPGRWTLLCSRATLIFQRPRFSLEAAYVGALLIFLVFGGVPVGSVSGIASTTLAGFRLNVVEMSEDISEQLNASWKDYSGTCEGQIEERVRTTRAALEVTVETIQRSGIELKSLSEDRILIPIADMLEGLAGRFQEQDRSSKPVEPPEDEREKRSD